MKQKEENKKVEINPSSERDIKFNSEQKDEVKLDNNNNNNNINNKNEENKAPKEEENNAPILKKRREISFLEKIKILIDLDILRTYINFITNTLFPKAGVTQSLFKLDKYKTVTILILNNFTDFYYY